MKKFLLVFSLICCGSALTRVYASHVMGADLTFQCIGPNKYLVTLEGYRDCTGITLDGPLTINYSSAQCGVNSTLDLTQVGPAVDITPTCYASSDACNGGSGPGIQKYTFQGTLTLPAGCGSDWVLSWTLCCRNAAITTINDPSNDNIYIEATLNNTTGTCVSSPTFANDPVAIYCENFPQFFNHGAIAPNGDSLTYSLLPSETGAGISVVYNNPYSGTNPMATTSGTNINSQTGQLSFTPSQQQVAVMKVGVNEYQNGVLVAHVERDMQILVINCTNSAPTAGGINGATGANANTYTTTACSNFCFTIQTSDAVPADSVFYTWIGTNLPGATITSNGAKQPLLTICWAPTQADVGSHSFIINLKNNDCPYYGTASIAYTVVVTGASDPPVSAGPDVHLCAGQSTTLTATSTGSVTSYTWSDGTTTHTGATWTVSPAVTTIYTVTAVYANGCQLTDQVTVYSDVPPTVSAFPLVTTLCSTSDSVQLSAFSNDATATFQWSPAAGLTCTTCANPKASPTASTTYTLVAVDAAGCPGAPVSVQVNLAPPPPAQSCSVIYASPTGTGTGTQNSPASLLAAIDSAACNNALIKLAIGMYTIDNPITNITSYTTIEGGFDPANDWRKASTAGATIIYRSALNMEGLGSNNARIVAIYMNGNSYFRFQDVTVQTANCPALAAGDTWGYSNYAFHFTNCANYNLTRCQVQPGTATGGLAGTSSAGTGGASTGGAGGAGGAGSATGCNKNGTAGTAGANASSGAAGGAKGAGATGNGCNTIGCGADAANGGAGTAGTAGIAGTNASGTAPAAPGTTTTFFNVAGQSASGTAGTSGGGGGGGGGGSKGSDCTCSVNGACTGGAGGNGGNGGLPGTGGYGGGGSFGIYLVSNGAGSTIVDCDIVAGAAGTGGTGGAGQAATAATGGTAGTAATGSCNPQAVGGAGAAGGAGGAGGSGQPGAPGVSAAIISNGTVPAYTEGGTAIAIATGINNPTVFNLAAQTTIYAANVSCTNRNDTLSSAASGTWNAGANASNPTGTGADLYTQYTATGRENIVYNGATYTGFVNIAIDQTTFVPVIQSSAPVLHTDTFWVCQGNTADFDMQIASADSFEWDFGGATTPNTYDGPNFDNLSNLAFNTAGTFRILARIQTSCCGWSPYDTAYIVVEPKATIGYTGDTSFCAGDSSHILITGTGSSYLWAPVAGLSCSTCTNVYAFPQVSTTYLVTSYSPRGLCNADTSIPITKLTPPTLAFTIIPAGCGSIGSATVTPTPAGNYTYVWSVPGNTATISNQPSGTYSITVTPVGSTCSVTASTSIGTNGGLQAYMAKSVSPLCNGLCTGQLRVEAIGGTAPFTYQWSPTASALDSLNNLCAGTYNVTITDHNNCTSSTSQQLTQPLPLTLAVLDTVYPKCPGQCTGSVILDGQGGTGPYTFTWSPAITPNVYNPVNLCAGSYAVTVLDNNNCPATGTVVILAPAPLHADTISTKEPACFGQSNGAITLGVSGGAYPYTYTWPQAPAITDSLGVNLAAGTYTTYIADSNHCKDTLTTMLNQPGRLSPHYTMDSVTCNGAGNGSITVTTTGGTPAYTYTLDGSGTYQASGTFTNLAAGAHTVTVKDANGCDSVVSFTIYQPPVLAASITYTRNTTCHDTCNGSILAAGSGGTAPYTYSKDGVTFTSADSFTALCAGPYTITVKDKNGCTQTANATVTQPTALSLTVNNVTDPSCFGESNGQIIITASGGTPTYIYDIDFTTPQLTGTFAGLAAGLHAVGAADANGCLDSLHILLTQPAQLVVDTLHTTEVSCFGGSNGTITLGVTGGTYPYTYSWPQAPAITDSLATGLAAGSYTAYVTDHNGCKDSVKAAITQPTRLSPTYTMDSVTCNGAANGSITVTTSGGTSPYTYTLDGGTAQASGTFTNLSAGAHTVTVKDANGCDSIVSFTIYQPPVLAASITYTINATCNGTCNGSILAAGSGGTAPYTYSQDGVAFTAVDSFTALCAGPYTITVKDKNGCMQTANTTVTQPTPLVLSPVDSVAPTCNDGANGSFTVIASGGTPTYTYSSNGGAYQVSGSFTNQGAGPNTVTAKDANGCTATYTITVPNPPATSTFDTATTPVSCFGGNNGTITTTLTGTTTPYTYSWTYNGTVAGTTPDLTGLKAGLYIVDITDGHGCRVFGPDSIPVAQPQQLSPTYVMDSVTCNGLSNATITVTTTGGVSPYTYSLDGGTAQASGGFTGLAAGQHTMAVNDANGCDSTFTFTIYQPQPLVPAILLTVNDSCFGYCDGLIVVSATGGVTPYQYTVDGVNYQSSGTFNNLCANPAYTFTVMDNNGCPNTILDSITQPMPVVVSPVDSAAPICFNGNNGSLSVVASGGTGSSYLYSVDGAPYQVNNTFNGETAGQHIVTAIDVNGCTGSYTITVPQAPVPSTFDTATVAVTCFGGSNGDVYTTITSGNTPVYTYSWTYNGNAIAATTDTLTGVPAGTYAVTITDGRGCPVVGPAGIPVGQPAQISETNSVTEVSCFGGDNGCISITPAGGVAPYANSWSNGNTTANPCTLTQGSYTDTITDANGCPYIASGIIVTQPSPIAIMDSVTSVSCAGDSNGVISVTDTGGTPGYTYAWSNGATGSTASGLKIGSYTVTVTDSKGCPDTTTLTVGVINPMVLNAQKSDVLCPPLQNGSINLPVTGGSPAYQFTWSNGASSSSLSGLNIGTYNVTITDARGCTIDTSFVLINDSAFAIAPNPDTVTINEGDQAPLSIEITKNNGGMLNSTIWDPNYRLSCDNCQATEATPLFTTQYTITATTDSGCVAVTQILVTVIPQHQLYIPNAFTPNGDGINDFWEAFGNKNTWLYCSVQVFDRWGEKIFESTDINFQWDGKYRGTYVEPNTYVYTFKVVFIDDYTVTNKGSITVIR